MPVRRAGRTGSSSRPGPGGIAAPPPFLLPFWQLYRHIVGHGGSCFQGSRKSARRPRARPRCGAVRLAPRSEPIVFRPLPLRRIRSARCFCRTPSGARARRRGGRNSRTIGSRSRRESGEGELGRLTVAWTELENDQRFSRPETLDVLGAPGVAPDLHEAEGEARVLDVCPSPPAALSPTTAQLRGEFRLSRAST